MKIAFTPESIEGLTRLREFIEIQNSDVAKRITDLLIDGISKLKRFPYLRVKISNAPNPELMRDLILENYTVRYLILDETINILKMWHHKENQRHKL